MSQIYDIKQFIKFLRDNHSFFSKNKRINAIVKLDNSIDDHNLFQYKGCSIQSLDKATATKDLVKLENQRFTIYSIESVDAKQLYGLHYSITLGDGILKYAKNNNTEKVDILNAVADYSAEAYADGKTFYCASNNNSIQHNGIITAPYVCTFGSMHPVFFGLGGGGISTGSVKNSFVVFYYLDDIFIITHFSFDEGTDTFTLFASPFNALSNIIISGKEIPDEAFYEWSIEDAKVASGVEKIGRQAFKNTFRLKHMSIPNTVSYIGPSCFELAGIRKIDFNGNTTLRELCDDTFYESRLENIDIPDSVQHIGKRCFENCESLTNVKIPDGLLKIDEGAFHNCPNLNFIVSSTSNAYVMSFIEDHDIKYEVKPELFPQRNESILNENNIRKAIKYWERQLQQLN